MTALVLHQGRMAVEQIGSVVRITLDCPTTEEADLTFARIAERIERGDQLQLDTVPEKLPKTVPVIPGPAVKRWDCTAFMLYPEPHVRHFEVKAINMKSAVDAAIGAYPQLKKLHVAEGPEFHPGRV